MYQSQYAWNLAFFHNWRASRPGIDRWRLFDMFAKLALNYQIVITKKKELYPIKKKWNHTKTRKTNKETRKKKRHLLIPKKARLWNVTLFNFLLKHHWFSCQAVTYYVLSVFLWSCYKNRFMCYSNHCIANCMSRKRPYRQCLKYWLLRF